jgi:flagellar biogenesis protein FliO
MRYLALVVVLLAPVSSRHAGADDREMTGLRQFTPLEAREFQSVTWHAPEAAEPPLRLAPRKASQRQAVARPAAASPGRALGTVAASLGGVLALFFVVSWCLQRTGNKGNERLPKEAMEVLGQAPLAGRQQAQLVRLGNKLLLVAITPGGAETLAEVTEPREVEALLAMCRRGQAGSATASFREALVELSGERRGGR